MAAKKPLPDRVQLKGLDSLFGIDQEQTGQVLDVPIRELFPFQNHPFKVLDDEKMAQTVESVRENGILVPIMVRNRPEGGYEVISGHRRKHAAEIVGLETVPVIIRDLTDDEAVIAMVDANLQREEILPSEKAFAYKMKLDAIKRQNKAGRPESNNSRQVGENLWSVNQLSDGNSDSARTIQRYIRLTELQPELQEMVDTGKIAMTPAVEISYLKPKEQELLLETIDSEQATPSLSQAQRMKKLSQVGGLNEDTMLSIMSEQKKPELSSNITLPGEKLKKYFPKSYTPAQIENTIFKLLDSWLQRRQRDQSR
jgi:ParB family chromosome partitioning protein